jgi:2,5-diketo-D-gluconate reductase A
MIPSVALNDGHSIPQLGIGTWPLNDAEVAEVVVSATALGYRHIDTAAKYGNEKGVGAGIRDSGIDRADLFVTTKLDGGYQGGDRAVAGLEASLARLGLDYVDLLLIHWPAPWLGQYVSTWKTFEKLRSDGLARSIGVSNFKPAHLDALAAETGTVPVVNQIELDPRITRQAQRDYDSAHGIVTESYSPFGGGGASLLRSPVLAAVGQRYGKTAGQVVVRWHLQNGLVVIPKSSSPTRLAENADVFDFELDADDLAQVATLDRGPDAGVDSDVSGH